MKKYKSIYLVLIIFLTSCTSIKNPQREEVFVVTGGWLDDVGINWYNNLANDLSPDGKWLAETYYDEEGIFHVQWISNSDQENILYEEDLDRSGKFLASISWSPDSSALLTLGTDIGVCAINRIVFYSINEHDDALTVHEYELDDEAGHCVKAKWSPDGSRVAVSVDNQEILILDAMANLKQRIPCNSGSLNRMTSFDWVGSNQIVYMLRHLNYLYQTIGFEFRMIDLSSLEIEETVIASESPIFFIGSDPENQKIMYVEIPESEEELFLIKIVDLQSGELEQPIQISGTYDGKAISMDQRYVAILIKGLIDPDDGHLGDSLWLYDWRRNESNVVTNVYGLVGWNPDYDGFLVFADYSNGELIGEVIVP